MKKRLFMIFILTVLVITGCRGQERPNDRVQLETNQSSIFDMAKIEYCKINTDNTIVKSGFGNQFDDIGTLNKNDVVKVLDHVGDWYAIQLDNNRVGAIQTNLAQPVIQEDANLSPATEQQSPQLVGDPDVIGIPAEDQEQPARDQRDIAPPQTPGIPETPREPEAESPTPGTADQRAQTDRTPTTTDQAQTPTDRQPRATEGQTTNVTEQERQMIDLVNRERQQNDLPPLQTDFEVTRVARIKSQDIVDNNYFSHYSPTYGSPFEMLDSFGVKYLHAGENLAGNNSVQNAHTALMNSSGHRKNILNPDFTHIGIGVKPSNRYGYVYTQMFISKPR